MYACGEIGLGVDYFYSLTPRQFDNIVIGFRRKQENEFKENWSRTRSLMFATLQPHLKKKTATEKDILIFPWETEETPEIDLNAEILAVEKQKLFWEKLDAKRNQA